MRSLALCPVIYSFMFAHTSALGGTRAGLAEALLLKAAKKSSILSTLRYHEYAWSLELKLGVWGHRVPHRECCWYLFDIW